MRKNMWVVLTLNGVILALALLVTLCGLASFRPGQAYPVQNSYGETILLWGAGVYAHDSQFKAPIFIGSDLTILAGCPSLGRRDVPAPVETAGSGKPDPEFFRRLPAVVLCRQRRAGDHLQFAASGLYSPAGSLLLRCGVPGRFPVPDPMPKAGCVPVPVTRGMHAYLILGGISLFVAWLPDILSSLASGTSLALIEVYTTEITNVLDMGIISPLLFLTLALVKNHCFMGYVLLRMALRVCMGVGIMLPVQTVCQLLAGIVLPLPALITKVGIFVLLAGASFWLERCLRRATVYLE